MKTGNVLEEKSFSFAIRIVNLYGYLRSKKREFCLSKQVLRSGTSIGANIAESIYAESSQDFIHKLAIAQKECSESMYWIRLLARTDYLKPREADSLLTDCIELIKLLTSIIKTKKKNLVDGDNN